VLEADHGQGEEPHGSGGAIAEVVVLHPIAANSITAKMILIHFMTRLPDGLFRLDNLICEPSQVKSLQTVEEGKRNYSITQHG